jgi:hypothetical protein
METDSGKRYVERQDVRLRVVLDDQVNLNMAATLDMTEEGALIATGVYLEPGTHVSIFPLCDELDANLAELRGEVVRTFEDILVEAYADDRYRMGVRFTLDDRQKQAVRRLIQLHRN